jgi:putative peptidoglycan lipid II flippase
MTRRLSGGPPDRGESGPHGDAPGDAPFEGRVVRDAAVATAGTALSRVTGVLRLGAMAYALGVAESRLADTYNLANTTPNIVYELVLGGVLSAVLLRVYVEVRQREGEEAGWRFIARVVNLSTLVLAAVTVMGIVLAPLILNAYTLSASGADRAAQRELGTLLLRLFVPQVLFYGYSTITTAVLQAHRRFGVPMFAPVLNNLVVVAALVAFALTVPAALRSPAGLPLRGRLLLGIGTTAGVAALGLVPWLAMRRVGYRRIRGAGFWDPSLRRLAVLSTYTLGYVATNQVGLWVTLVLANQVQGGVTAYQTAFVFFQLPHGLFTVSISTALTPGLAERAVAGDTAAFGRQVVQGLRAVTLVTLPAVAGYLAIAPAVVRVLLEHGIVTGRSTDLVALVLRGFVLGLLFFSSFHLLLRSFQALGDTRTPMFVNLAAFVVNMAVNVALFVLLSEARQKVAGLAVGHAASYLFAAAALLVILRRRLGGLDVGPLARTVAKCALAAAATGAGAALVAKLLAPVANAGLWGQVLQILGAVAVGLLIYAGAARALRVEELAWIKGLLRRAE